MQWRGLRISVIMLAFFASLGIFFGARELYNKVVLEDPLADVFSSHKAVLSYKIERRQPVTQISIHLAPTSNLKDDYQQIYRQVQLVLGERPFEIKIIDNRNEKLTRAYYFCQFALYEASERGNYREMIDFVEDLTKKMGVSATIYLDEKNIYFLLRDDSYYLYEIIARREFKSQ